MSAEKPGSIIIEYLQAEFDQRKEKNSRYSKRAFAHLLDINSSTLSQLLGGKRALTFAMAHKLLSQLRVDEHEKNKLLLTLENPDSYASPKAEFRDLSEKEIAAVSAWQFYAILCALEIPGIDTAEKISEKIGCHIDMVNTSLETLLSLNMVEMDEEKILLQSGPLSAFNLPPLVRRLSHRSAIGRALHALERFEDESDFSGVTMAIAKNKLPEAARRIKDFRRSLLNYLEDGEKEEVYALNIQLFPMK